MKPTPNKYTSWYILFLLIISSSFVSCYDDESFSPDPNLQLDISMSTVPFDTIFANVDNPMKIVKIYNNNDHSITIDSIYLQESTFSSFKMNINGRPGAVVKNVEVLKSDSVYLFIQPKNNEISTAYQAESDNVILTWNGNSKTIPITALQKQIQVLNNLTVTTDTIINQDCYIVGNLTVTSGAKLEINNGANLYFEKSAFLYVNGTIKTNGTLDKPIVLRGAAMNKAEDGILNDNHTAQWNGIVIGATSASNVFQNTMLKNANKGIEVEKSEINTSRLKIYNSYIHNCLYFGIQASNANIGIYNSCVSNSYGPLIQLIGGEVELVQNTFANYFEWYKRSATPSVVLIEQLEADTYSFSNLVIANNLIVGRRTTELKVEVSNPNYTFTNNLVQVETLPTYEGVNNYWNISSPFVFENLNQDGSYFYSFKLIQESNADVFSHAATQYSSSYPLDIIGYARPTLLPADIGCYQHQW